MKKNIIFILILFLLALLPCSVIFAEGDIEPPPDGGGVIIPPDGDEPVPGTHYVFLTMPEPDKPDKPDIPGGYWPYSYYGYHIAFITLQPSTIDLAAVSMNYRESYKDPWEVVTVSIAESLQELQNLDVDDVVIIIRYNNRFYKGTPDISIVYSDGADNGVQYQVGGFIDPPEINVSSWEGFITANISVEGDYAPQDINIDTIRITRINGQGVEYVYCETDPALIEITPESARVQFNLWDLRGILPAGQNVTIRIDGNFDNGVRFFCVMSISVIKPGVQEWITPDEGGIIEVPGKVLVSIPAGAVTENIEVSVDIGIAHAEHVWNNTSQGAIDYAHRNQAADLQGLVMVGDGVRCGPEGIDFLVPAGMSLYYFGIDVNESQEQNLKIYYWNAADLTWEERAGSKAVPDERRVTAFIDHFSIYQIMYESSSNIDEAVDDDEDSIEFPLSEADAVFKKGEIYSFPNPAKNGAFPTIHIESGIADKISIHIYDIGGALVHSADINDQPIIIDGKYAYEYRWDTSGVASGIYIYSVRVIKDGYSDILGIQKLAVIK
ncbi:MAG: hypothetical protein ABII23_04670 [bacterium]